MFKSLGLLQSNRCPDEPCLRPHCFFAHSQATSTAGPSRPRTSTSTGIKRTSAGVEKGGVEASTTVKSSEVNGKRKRDINDEIPRTKATTTASTSGSGLSPATRLQAPAKPPTTSRIPGTVSMAAEIHSNVSGSSRPTTVSTTARPANGSAPTQANGAPGISRESKDLKSSRQPYADRQKALQTIFTQYTKLYSDVSTLDPDLASRCSIEEETEISATSTDMASYKRAIHHAAVSISLRVKPDTLDHPSIGTNRESRLASTKAEKEKTGRLTRGRCERYLLPLSSFPTWRYPDPSDPALSQGGTEPDAKGSMQNCDRCGQPFLVTTANLAERAGECVYHYGKMLPDKINGKKVWAYTCCRKERGTGGCHKGVHIFNEREDDVKLASRVGFKTVKQQVQENRLEGRAEAFVDVVGMDCEMIYTTSGYTLARATIVDEKGEIILDELVRQTAGIIDLNTRFSGVTQSDLDKSVMDIKAVRAAACMFIGPQTIIVGHGLENDLRALRLLYDRVIDTAVVFPHDKGPPFRRALRDLVKEKLGYFIQELTTTGHSSAEDAKATLEVLQWKVRQDGTLASM